MALGTFWSRIPEKHIKEPFDLIFPYNGRVSEQMLQTKTRCEIEGKKKCDHGYTF